ncbi:hypothetical protein DSL72_002983 [Monilinia vaccinii-corymbosi]|uniref:Large ribosomal subunit protein uL30m n=1 Tax=Monilinia vaccinii-corymbosi TaxID=61207 RepID=A0A8A3PE95_9HELO|nr:hypothetical protein DSL72_002983 [Monilinia vaccinii-corymbosi]
MSTSTAAPLTRTLISSSKALPPTITLRQTSKASLKTISATSPLKPNLNPKPKPKLAHLPWPNATPSYFHITLTRSAIGLPRKSARVLKFLGLHKRTASVYHPVSSEIAGQIMKVKELVTVEETKEKKTKREQRESRRPEPGFVIEKAVV